jgi:hypothetical protein
MVCSVGIKCTATICSLYKPTARDCDSQLQFCRWVLHKNVDEPDFLRRVQWTFEAELARSGTTNHNLYELALENPHTTRESTFNIELEAGFGFGYVNEHLVRPYIKKNLWAGTIALSSWKQQLLFYCKVSPWILVQECASSMSGHRPTLHAKYLICCTLTTQKGGSIERSKPP